MTAIGTVRVWREDEGWGVIDSDETPGGCWAHFSAAAVPGYATFSSGQKVHLDWESPGQDGYDFRAVRVWPYDSEAIDKTTNRGPSAAYRSTLTLSFDHPDEAH
jgi:CspA family cold shock protein